MDQRWQKARRNLAMNAKNAARALTEPNLEPFDDRHNSIPPDARKHSWLSGLLLRASVRRAAKIISVVRVVYVRVACGFAGVLHIVVKLPTPYSNMNGKSSARAVAQSGLHFRALGDPARSSIVLRTEARGPGRDMCANLEPILLRAAHRNDEHTCGCDPRRRAPQSCECAASIANTGEI